MAAMTGDYQFSAEPRTVKAKVGKYRDQEDGTRPTNIMIDKRVVRGNTFASMIIPASTQQELEKKQEADKKKLSQFQTKEKTISNEAERETGTPEPVEGRQHIDIQTDNIPEELSEKPVEHNIEVQTDYYIDRPPTPLFMPKKIGEDQNTQVEDGELFDFNLEVDPILEVLVGKTLEMSLMEVLEEEELAAMKNAQAEFEQKRKNELNEVQNMEVQEINRREEAKTRKYEALKKKETFELVHKKYVSRIMSKKFLSKLPKTAFEDLKSLGTYSDIQEISFYDQLIPWMVESTADRLSQNISMHEIFNHILHDSFLGLKSHHVEALQKEKDRRHNEELSEIQRQKDDEARRKNRVQARINRKIQQELKALRLKIEEKVLSTGVISEKISTCIFHDIDGRQSENIIGTPGGLLGELIFLFSEVEEELGSKISQDQMNAILLDYISHNMRSPVMVYNNLSESSFIDFLKSLGKPGLSPETIHSAPDDVKPLILNFLLSPENLQEGTSLTVIWRNLHEFHLREGLIEAVLTSFFSVLTLKDLDATHPNPNRLKVDLRPVDLPAHREVAVIKIKPNIKENEEGVAEEVEGEDRILTVNPSNDELSVYVIHLAAQRLLRNDLTYWIKTVRGFEALDLEKLKLNLKIKAQEREDKLISLIAKDLPVFEF
jgi:hypothetical protein